jgi:hypothetical protein
MKKRRKGPQHENQTRVSPKGPDVAAVGNRIEISATNLLDSLTIRQKAL